MDGESDEAMTIIERLETVLDHFDRHRLLVLGDVILDEYLLGSAERLSPEAPVPIVQIESEDAVLGGAGNVARNVVALGARCDLVAVVGNDEAGRRVQDLARKTGLLTEGLVVDAARPTSHKTRVLARAQQMIRFDRESTEPLGVAVLDRVLESLVQFAPGASGALMVDYGKGTLSSDLSRRSVQVLSAQGVPIAADPKNDLDPLRGVALIKPNLAEAEILTGVSLGEGPVDGSPLFGRLSEVLPGTDIVVTCGRSGMVVQAAGAMPRSVPTWPRDVFDVQGAGDTSLASLWLATLSGATQEESAMIANAAAGVVVGKVGTAVANREEIRARLPQAVAAFEEGE
jgi:D-beta-D-heptose 7-phosphate kinase/D-beta-D-heptose 1-phosphate adenosyltransferase